MGQIPHASRNHTRMQVPTLILFRFLTVSLHTNKLPTRKAALVIIDFSFSIKMKQFQLIDIRLDYKILCQESQRIFAESYFSVFFTSAHRASCQSQQLSSRAY